MKRIGFIYEDIFSRENIAYAMEKAACGKRSHDNVKNILNNKSHYVNMIYNMMKDHRFVPSLYIHEEILECANKKVRVLSKTRYYPDQIVYWCLYNKLYPTFTKPLIRNTFSCIRGRGQIDGMRRVCKKLYTCKKLTKYYLKCDIRKFFPSVDNQLLYKMIERKIKDPHVLTVLADMFALEPGIPLGNVLSQLFSNYFLNELDHELEPGGLYFRYADDMILFSNSKKKLHEKRRFINQWLKEHNLQLKDNWQIYVTAKNKVDFMGFRMDGHCCIMRKRIMYRFNRAVTRWRKHKNVHNAGSVMSYFGWLKYTYTVKFKEDRVDPFVDKEHVRAILQFRCT